MLRHRMLPIGAAFFAGLLLASLQVPGAALAAKGDCGQPSSSGASPTGGDALTILKSAVGIPTACDVRPCICDTNGNGKIDANDALLGLRHVVGIFVPQFSCNCPPPACTSARLTTLAGSVYDAGWTGLSHDSELPAGVTLTLRAKRRCQVSGNACESDSECPSGHCLLTCDCEGDDTECEVEGPTDAKQCRTSFRPCASDDDCSGGDFCVHAFGPPLPMSLGIAPICVVTTFAEDVSGTVDTATGETVLSARLRGDVFLGIDFDQPCPRCGAPSADPRVGEQYVCEGGQHDGAACTVEAVTPSFGGASSDCPPSIAAKLFGSGPSVPLSEITTGGSSRTAALPCANFTVSGHPSRGNGKCLDTKEACASNADCRRCSGDPAASCQTDDDCAGAGVCAEAPDQPVSCGFWCHCGFCDNDPNAPCFSDDECSPGAHCTVGLGVGSVANAPQQKPNDCSADGFLCGTGERETCAETSKGVCELQPSRVCGEGNPCPVPDGGECVAQTKGCFESRIAREGSAAPLGSYCRSGAVGEPCATNADCGDAGECAGDAMPATMVALACLPGTSHTLTNSAAGLPGPAAVTLRSFLEFCRCGDGAVGCDEQCDDGNPYDGDGCDRACRPEP